MIYDKQKNKLSLPDALIKSLEDPFDYALGLKDKSVIFFSHAELLSEEWIKIFLASNQGRSEYFNISGLDVKFGLDRGLEIRISEIVWVADAPFGS